MKSSQNSDSNTGSTFSDQATVRNEEGSNPYDPQRGKELLEKLTEVAKHGITELFRYGSIAVILGGIATAIIMNHKGHKGIDEKEPNLNLLVHEISREEIKELQEAVVAVKKALTKQALKRGLKTTGQAQALDEGGLGTVVENTRAVARAPNGAEDFHPNGENLMINVPILNESDIGTLLRRIQDLEERLEVLILHQSSGSDTGN